MSDDPEGRSPDLTRPVLGFRIWNVGVRGTLGAIAAGSIWSKGFNEAVCCPGIAPRRRPKHTSPHPGCACGFNAYSTLHRDLKPYPGTVLGVIAAWGVLDVYRTGFRAQFAQVLALALPGRRKVSEADRARFELASRLYGVPLVARRDLEAEGLKHAAPVPEVLLPGVGSRPAPPPVPAGASPKPLSGPLTIATWRHARGTALWIRGHAALRCRSEVVEVCPAPGASALLGVNPTIRTRPIGASVRAGEVLAEAESAYPGRVVRLRAPVAGTVSALNAGFAAALLHRDITASASPWLVGMRPDEREPLDDAPLVWGRAGAELYRRSVAGRSDDEILGELEGADGRSAGELRPLAQAPARHEGLLPLADHHRSRRSIDPASGRRASIMVAQLRPLLEAVGAAEPGDLLAA